MVYSATAWCQGMDAGFQISIQSISGIDLSLFCSIPDIRPASCYDFRQLRQLSTVVVSKIQSQMSLEECKSWTCIVLLGLRAKVQVERLSIKD